ncbi:DUF938 domain-containing protein [Sphingomonas piscis]|uniref:DUF938 domain-containing protein n=1 Tax=Sphingomonas piscis TaxID=2714943 RepID=A0A6G7YLW7_9SPHN|nr:DUF938 domain-containing protein [Sphingomonas piscis]QIK77706.1 DUF938 domain-containing protein [Sphingomonas piscis]
MRRSAPSALRNRAPIADVLRDWLPRSGDVLEVASGTGEHVVFFGKLFPHVRWQPSDADPRAIESIGDWVRHCRLANVSDPILRNAASTWPHERWASILCINMVHISAWESTLGLLANAAKTLDDHGSLIFYGPWFEDGRMAVESNRAFDAELRSRNPAWGIRTVEALGQAAADLGLRIKDRREMPANNLMLQLTPVSGRR